MNRHINAGAFILLLLAASLQVQAKLTFPIYHAQQTLQHQASTLKEAHQASYYVYHNLRNMNTHHNLRHELHMSATKEVHDIIPMGYFFTLPLKIAGLQYNLNVDTGSSDLFIKGEHSPGMPKDKYSCPKCLADNQKMDISYLDGTLMTYLKQLPIQFGPHKFNEFLLVAFTAPKTFQKPQGIVGLSFPLLARNPHPNFIQTLINNKIIDTYSFGVNFNFQNNHSSSISFGQPDTDRFEGSMTKVKLDSSITYRIKINSFQVGQGPHFAVPRALLDTGNSCISVPKRFSALILNEFNLAGANKCAFDNEPFAKMFSLLRCRVKDFSKLPSVNIYIDGTKFEVDKDAYTQRCVWDGGDSLCDFYIEVADYTNELLIGDGFFNRYYTYFDIQNLEIGFAKNKEKLDYKNMYKNYSELDNEDKEFFAKLK